MTAADRLHVSLIRRLRTVASPARAEKEKSYQKSVWQHWGVALPQMDTAIREILNEVPASDRLALSRRLWREPVWDLKIVAGRVLAAASVPPTELLWRFVTARMADLDGWAIADNLAPVASRCLLHDPGRLDVVESWVQSPHLWTRRAALVFTLAWTRNGRDPERMMGWASDLAGDREWFIQKAIGWWLRELSKRDAARVRRFLADHDGLKGVARREGSKYL